MRKAKLVAQLLSIKKQTHVSPKSVAIALARSNKKYNLPIEKLEKAASLARMGALKWMKMGQNRAAGRQMAETGAKKWLSKARGNLGAARDSVSSSSSSESGGSYSDESRSPTPTPTPPPEPVIPEPEQRIFA